MSNRDTRPRRPGDITGQLYRRQAITRAKEIHDAAKAARLEEIATALDDEAARDEVIDYTNGATHGQA